MMILQIVVFLAPAFVAAYVAETVRKRTTSRKKFWFDFCLYSCLILWFNSIIQCQRGWNEFAFERMSVQFLTKYLFISIVLAFALPYLCIKIDWIIGRYITGKYTGKH